MVHAFLNDYNVPKLRDQNMNIQLKTKKQEQQQRK